jgi:hypothetical protein
VTISTSGGGGVTSLNGQTGALTTTSVNDIGSTMFLFYAVSGSGALNTTIGLSANGTYAGSNLRYNPSNINNSYGGLSTVEVTNNQNWSSGGTALSGTWRSMMSQGWFAKNNLGCCNFKAVWTPVLFVRVS